MLYVNIGDNFGVTMWMLYIGVGLKKHTSFHLNQV